MGKHFDNAESVHFRLFEKEATIVSDQLSKITKAARFTGLTISEFCRMAAVEKAKLVLLEYHKNKVKIAKKILLEENLRLEKKKLEKEEFDDDKK